MGNKASLAPWNMHDYIGLSGGVVLSQLRTHIYFMPRMHVVLALSTKGEEYFR